MNKLNKYTPELAIHSDAFMSRIDPVSRIELGHYARQIEMVDFLSFVGKLLVEKFKAWNRRTVDYMELSAKPDYLLRDIGIRRDQIQSLIYGNKSRDELAKPTPAKNTVGLLPESIQSLLNKDLRQGYLLLSPTGGPTIAGYHANDQRAVGSVDFEPVFEKDKNAEGNAKFDADLEKSLAA